MCKKIHMQDKIVSRVWKNLTDTTNLFHSCEILLWNKISHAMKNCFTCVKKISHVLKKFQNSFHMHSENFTCMWMSAVVFPTFISHGFCFSHAFHILFLFTYTCTPTSVMKSLFACFLAEKCVSSLWNCLQPLPRLFAWGRHGKYSPSREYPCSIWSGHCQLVFTICGFSKLFTCINLILVSWKLCNHTFTYA